jgi:hypothetical protein
LVLSSTGQLSQKTQILSKSGRDTTQPINILLTYRSLDGGFGGSVGYPSNALDTALALQALAAAGSTDIATVTGAVSYLLSAQNPDGGWGFVSGQASHVYYTAVVMQALETQTQTTAIASALTKATAYLTTQQLSDGSWGSVPDTALAVLALVPVTTDATRYVGGVNVLLALQQPDGSWNQDPYATALALQALHLVENLTLPADPTKGSVMGGVVESGSFLPVSGVTVSLAELPTTTAQTDANGTFSLTDLTPGAYTLRYQHAGYVESTQAVTITAGLVIDVGAVTLTPSAETGILSGIVTEAIGGQPISGATVGVTGGSSVSVITDPNGRYSLVVSPGGVVVTAGATGYEAVGYRHQTRLWIKWESLR